MSVDLPLPLTPVTTVNAPSGIRTVMFLRLCSVQPERVRKRVLEDGGWGDGDWAIVLRPVR